MPVKWMELERFTTRTPGFSIRTSGGDKIIKGPNGKVHLIGHNHCSKNGKTVPRGHLQALKRKFGVTEDDIKNC